MSIANPYNYDPLRVVDPARYQYQAYAQQSPTLGEMKQDTGWPAMPPYSGGGTGGPDTYDGFPRPPFPGGQTLGGWTRGDFTPRMADGPGSAFTAGWSGASGQVPYTAPSTTGGATGHMAAGWSPWSLYDGRDNYDGTANDGYYNAGADRANWVDNGQAENDRNRVWRWTLDDMARLGLRGDNPQQAAQVQQLFLANVSRLKRDYQAPENQARGLNWATSAFAAYDPTIPDPTAQAWHQAIQNTGASPVADQNGGGGNPQPTPAPAPSPTAQTTTPGAGGMFYGQAPGEIANSPDLAYRALLLKMGIDPNIHGMFSSYLKQRLGPAIQAIINASRANGALPGNFDQVLGDIGAQAFGQGGNWMQYAGGVADKALANVGGTYGANADMSVLQNYIQSLLGLKAEGLNPVAASGLANSFQDTIGAYGDQGLQNGGKDKSSFLPYFQGTNFYKSLAGR